VGTITEIYDYFRLLYTTVGIQKCPNHPEIELKKNSIADILADLSSLDEGVKFHILAPIRVSNVENTLANLSKTVLDRGFVRYQVGDMVFSVGETPAEKILTDTDEAYIVIDRLTKKTDPESITRLRDSLAAAYQAGEGKLSIYRLDTKQSWSFHAQASCPICDFELQPVTLSNFSFNSHY
jgi:excinuclease ABC subunit A